MYRGLRHRHFILALARYQDIVTRTTDQGVVARIPDQDVVKRRADDVLDIGEGLRCRGL